jgi:hypothetical protein
MGNETMPLTPQDTIAPPPAADAKPKAQRLEPYEGPATGYAWKREGTRSIAVRMMLTASKPGQLAEVGDVFLEFAELKKGRPTKRKWRFQLDVGAKRFLFSMLEQAITIGDFRRGE